MRARARIAEFIGINCFTFRRLLLGLKIEPFHQSPTVMLRNKLLNAVGQLVPLGQFQAIRHVTQNDASAGLRIQRIMRIHTLLIFTVKRRAIHFANVVVKRPHANEGTVRLDLLSCLFGQVSHHDAVMVRARCAAQQFLQQRMIQPGQLLQLQRGGDAKQAPQNEKAYQRQRR